MSTQTRRRLFHRCADASGKSGLSATRLQTGVYAGFLFWAFARIGGLSALAAAEEISLQGSVPAGVQEIEVVYIESRAPTVSLKGAAVPLPPSQRPSGPTVDLLGSLGQVLSFGGCKHLTDWTDNRLTIQTQPVTNGLCGHELLLRQQGTPLDGLSYDTLHLRGETSGKVTFALVDKAAHQHEDNVPLTSMTGRFDSRVSLGPAARRVDLRNLASLVLLPQEKTNTVVLETLTLEQSARLRSHALGLGFWVWEYREALTRSDAVLDDCQHFACTRILVQIPAAEDPPHLWTAYARFLRAAQARGIEAFALDGYPEAIYDPGPLVEKVKRLMTLTVGRGVTGVQLDIEPYLLADFFADESGFVRYLAAINQIKDALAQRARLSVVMPFWLTSYTAKGRPVAFSVMDRVDEVAIMSYRTDTDELRAVAEDSLRYGDIAGVPVWLAIETQALPLERHVVLKRELQRDLADAYLDRATHRLILEPPPTTEGLDWFRVHHRVTVRPERLTFANQNRQQVQAAVAAITSTTPNLSLAGVIIHDLKGFLALPESQ